MNLWLIGCCLAFAIGVGIAALNYGISRAVLRSKPNLYPVASLLRAVLHIGYLVAVYFTSPLLPWGQTELLFGAALGITLPLLYFTPKLLSVVTAKPTKKEESSRG